MSSDLDLKILTGRKGYEFTLDGLRLTMFGAEQVYAPIKEAFHFQAHGLVSPPPTFGPVGQTIPPGLVFQIGIWVADDGSIVPIRFLHIESARIVIDVAGPSSAAAAIFQRLQDVTSEIKAPDGSPIIGEPVRALDFSELSVRLNSPLENLIAPKLRTVLIRAVRESSHDDSAMLLPSIVFRPAFQGTPFDGALNLADGRTFSLSARGGVAPEDHRVYSSAPLDTDAHITFIEALAASLS